MCQKIAPSTAGSHAFSYARSGSVRATLRPLFIHSAAARARRDESASILRLVKNKVKQSVEATPKLAICSPSSQAPPEAAMVGSVRSVAALAATLSFVAVSTADSVPSVPSALSASRPLSHRHPIRSPADSRWSTPHGDMHIVNIETLPHAPAIAPQRGSAVALRGGGAASTGEGFQYKTALVWTAITMLFSCCVGVFVVKPLRGHQVGRGVRGGERGRAG